MSHAVTALSELSINSVNASNTHGMKKCVSFHHNGSVSSKLQLSDFELVKKIGQGGFGEVHLCRKKDTGEVLALKIVRKTLIWKKNKIRQIKNERDVLAKHLTRWMVQLMYSFQDKHHLYLAMEYCPGGDLRHFLSVIGCLEEAEARVYMAEMIISTFSLHKLGYIHRDLKPDNFLIDSTGHLKLTDFGLSVDGFNSNVTSHKLANQSGFSHRFTDQNSSHHHNDENNENMPRNTYIGSPLVDFSKSKTQGFKQNGGFAFSVVGSPNYMSPEVLKGEHGYGPEVDWWSLGCIFFELVVGCPPFVGDSPEQVFNSILDWKNVLPHVIDDYRDSVSPEFIDFILKFLCDPQARFGSSGLEPIFSHPFFDGFDVDKLYSVKPPFVPNLEDEFDTSYFAPPPQTVDSSPSSISNQPQRSIKNQDGSFASYNMDTDELDNNNLRMHANEQDSHTARYRRSNLTPQHHPDSTPSQFNPRASSSIQCPKTAPRRFAHSKVEGSSYLHSRNHSADDDFPLVSPTYHHRSSLRAASSRKQSSYGLAGIGGRLHACFTPLHLSSPDRDIAGFTFQRKKIIRHSINSMPIKLDFEQFEKEESFYIPPPINNKMDSDCSSEFSPTMLQYSKKSYNSGNSPSSPSSKRVETSSRRIIPACQLRHEEPPLPFPFSQ